MLFARKNVEACPNTRILSLLEEQGELRGLSVENKATGETRSILCDGLFVAIGLLPQNDAFSSLAPLDANGYFDSSENCLTPTPGLFTAGDCRKRRCVR